MLSEEQFYAKFISQSDTKIALERNTFRKHLPSVVSFIKLETVAPLFLKFLKVTWQLPMFFQQLGTPPPIPTPRFHPYSWSLHRCFLCLGPLPLDTCRAHTFTSCRSMHRESSSAFQVPRHSSSPKSRCLPAFEFLKTLLYPYNLSHWLLWLVHLTSNTVMLQV